MSRIIHKMSHNYLLFCSQVGVTHSFVAVARVSLIALSEKAIPILWHLLVCTGLNGVIL